MNGHEVELPSWTAAQAEDRLEQTLQIPRLPFTARGFRFPRLLLKLPCTGELNPPLLKATEFSKIISI